MRYARAARPFVYPQGSAMGVEPYPPPKAIRRGICETRGSRLCPPRAAREMARDRRALEFGE